MNPVSERMDDLRFRNGQSQRNESSMHGLYAMSGGGVGTQLPSPLSMLNDSRGSLTRRFTTDSARIPTMGSFAVQKHAVEGQEYVIPSATQFKVHLLEKKKLEYERLKEQKRRFTAEMRLLDLQQRQEERELAQMQDDLTRVKITNSGVLAAGYQSEPSTPPEYRDSNLGFPSAFSRPNRYSASSLTSPLGLYSRPGRSGSQLTSPPSGLLPSRYAREEVLARSVPGSRRNSDEDEKEEAVRQDPSSHNSANGKNRYSMPVGHSRTSMNEMLSVENKKAIGNLLDDEETSLVVGKDGVPLLGKTNTGNTIPEYTADNAGWNVYTNPTRRRGLTSSGLASKDTQNVTDGSIASDVKHDQSYRRSMEPKQYFDEISSTSTLNLAPPKLVSSFSTNDIPTVKTTSLGLTAVDPSSRAQQQFHNHNASLGRIPPNAVNNRLSREIVNNTSTPDVGMVNHRVNNSALHANAPAFGPQFPQIQMQHSQAQSGLAIDHQYGTSGYNYTGHSQNNQHQPYSMSMLTNGLQQLNTSAVYNPNNPYAYNGMYQQNDAVVHQGGYMPRDSQAQVIQQRRNHDGEAMNKFIDRTVEDFRGQIYSLCKDQHGCRFLQRQLEERKANRVHIIWLETSQHITELMTDPFGNYLCQKLLEYSNDEQRTILVENAAQDLVRIALNQHGTRALQKMIEFISTPRQVQIIIEALRHEVVDLIQDLNGNHVIQKCLNKLTSRDAQFIFDAVGIHCIDVGTHRHGCCVLQRCIDHASGDQKAWLIRQISDNAHRLVQDPFGNYVVQYILDLNEPAYTEPLVMMFQGSVSALSRQKFSSNVIEKCLRCAQEPSKDMLVGEMLQSSEIGKLVRDQYSNYVIQTALDYARPHTRQRLVDAIRPMIPEIRNTPYGRRILAKITSSDFGIAPLNGSVVPSDESGGRRGRTLSVAHASAFVPGNGQHGGYRGARSQAALPSAEQIAAQSIQQMAALQPYQPAYNGYDGGYEREHRGGSPGNYI